MTNEGTSMLAALAAGTMEMHQKKSKGLTPVAGERPPSPQTIPATYPNDMPTEVMAEAATDIRRTIAKLEQALEALYEAGVPRPELLHPIPADVKSVEQEADEKFADRLKRQTEEAQAATFDKPAATGHVIGSWVCPTHGERVEKLSGRRKLLYGTCSQCSEFEKLP